MNAITVQILHQHKDKDKVVYEQEMPPDSFTLTFDETLSVTSIGHLQFSLPLLIPADRSGWIWRWLDGRMAKEFVTKRSINLLWKGYKKYRLNPLLIKARLNQKELPYNGIIWIDLECYIDKREVQGLYEKVLNLFDL